MNCVSQTSEMSRQPRLTPPPPPPPLPPLPADQSLGTSTSRPKPSLKNPARKPSNVQKVRFVGLDKGSEESLSLLGNIKMKKSHAHSSNYVADVVLPPPTLSSGEGEEIPLDGKSLGAETPSRSESPGVGASGALGSVGAVGGSGASSKPEAGAATSTPWKLQPKNLKDKLDNLLSPPPRFMRPDGRLFTPRGFVGLSNENESPRSSPPPGRFFVAFAIILALFGVALLIAVVVYNTRHIDRLFQELEEKKHNIVPVDVHDPVIEPLPPSAVRYANRPFSPGNETPLKEKSVHDEQTYEAQVPKKEPLGKVAFPDFKLFLEPKYPSNESNPVNAVLTGTFGSVNGTFDLTKIGDVIPVHMRKKRQVSLRGNRLTLNSLKSMRDDLRQQNEQIVSAMKAFDLEVKDVPPTSTNLDLSGMPPGKVVDFGKTLLKNRQSFIQKNHFTEYIKRIIANKEKGIQPERGALDSLVDKRQKNVNLIGEITSAVDVMENGPGKEDPKTNEISMEEIPLLSAETPSTLGGTPLFKTPSTLNRFPSALGVSSLPSFGTLTTPSTATGLPSTAAETPSTLAGTPSTLAGTPSTLAGTPSTLAGTPSTLAGTPSTIVGTPSTVAGTPSTVAGTPSTVAGTPSTVAGTLSTVAGMPSKVTETSSKVTETPSTQAETPSAVPGMPSAADETTSTPAPTPASPAWLSPTSPKTPSAESISPYGAGTNTKTAVNSGVLTNISEGMPSSNTATTPNGSENLKKSTHSSQSDAENSTEGLGKLSHNSVTATANPLKSQQLKKHSLLPMLEKNITLVHMGRPDGAVKGGNATLPHSEVSSPDRSGKKAELEKVELQENLQSMENATNGFARRDILCNDDHRSCSVDICIHKTLWCDGKVHCPDSADEIYCSCRDRVDRDRLCDGYFDCPNGEDELGCHDCERDEFNCGDFDDRGSAMCAPVTTRCDGRWDCPSGKDELSCSFLSDGILVGVPGQLAAVSMSQGVLHHNWRGHWRPVCWAEADIEWATTVCQEVVSRNITRYDVELDRVRVPRNKYVGKWISLSNGVSEQEDCEFASYVTCPPIKAGTRVPPTTDPNESHWDTPSTSGVHFFELIDSFRKKVHQLESLVDIAAATQGLGVNDVAGTTMNELQDVENLLESFPASNNHDGEVVRPQRMVDGRVVGGTPSRLGAWPWVVALYRDGKFFCGGAVLNEYWVLTAAHCVQEVGSHYMEIQAGMLRRSSFSPTEQIVTVDKVVVYSKFNFKSIQDDIALVHVSPALKLNRWVRPILLPSTKAQLDDPFELHITDPGNGHLCTVVGWGSTTEYGPAADNEFEVKIPVENCKSKSDRSGNDLCAGEPEGGRDACQGDSGGPLLCSVPENPSLWFAAGIVSHGEGCARPNTPGAYTRVSDYVDWIYQVMREDTDAKLSKVRYPSQTCPGFHCKSGTKRCIPKAKRCDRSVDCLNADDEKGCPAWDMLRSFRIARNDSNSYSGYSPFIPTTRNERVEPKAFHENTLESTGAGTKTDADSANAVVNNVHEIVTSVSATTTIAPLLATTPKPYNTTTSQPPIIFPGPKEPVEKGVTPAPLGEPLAPPPTEQVNPAPSFPTDGHNLIPTGSDSGRNHTVIGPVIALESGDVSYSVQYSELSSESSESGKSGEESSEESGAESDSAKPVNQTEQLEHPVEPVKPEHLPKKPEPAKPTEKPEHPSKKPKPFEEPPSPISVIPAPTPPLPEPTVSPPFVAHFDPAKDFLCANSRQKIIKERYCDGVADCLDSSDETKCTCREKLLALNPQAICDGLTDCFDGTDEEDCVLCPPGQIRCGLSSPPKCISQSAECDGVEDCPRGEDEEHCLALTDGTTVVLDRVGLPVIRSEGVIARKKRGVWKSVCGLSKTDRTATAWAFDACKDMGFNDWQTFNESSVADTALAVAFQVLIPLVGPVAPSPAPPSSPSPNVLAAHCSAIDVRCSPNVDGNTDRFLVAKGVHEWPWLAELLVDGVSTCTGVLVNLNWVVTSYQCLKTVGFDIQKNMLTALMGGSRSELGILEPNEQIRRADDIRLISNTDILMVHLPIAFIETRHVRPTGLPDWFSMARKALTCVAVGRGLQDSWESMILQHEVTCPSEGLGKTCFTPLVPNAGCTTNVTTPPWSGALVCRARTGWYPAAVFYEPYGRCGLAGIQAYDGLLFSLRNIRSLIDGPVIGGVNEPVCAGLRCPEGTCLPSHAACDGVPQCRDASDENPILCATLKEKCSPSNGLGCVCSPDEARCEGGHGCIPLTSWCDGRPDCADGSDEGSACGCADLLRVTRPHLLCDGRRHCDDHADEDPAMCGCVAGRFHCSRSGHCVSTDTVCDGRNDCPYGEDEDQCFSVRPFDAPSVSYNAFGEVVRRSYGLWHDMCAPPDPESQLNGATAACASIGMTLLAYDTAPRATNPTIAPLLLLDSSSDFVLINRSVISLRGDRPLAQISVITVLPEKCLALRVTCK